MRHDFRRSGHVRPLHHHRGSTAVRKPEVQHDVSEQQTIHAAGTWRPAATGATREILDPADATVIAVVAEGGAADADAAVRAARAAFDGGEWPQTPVAERAALLRRTAD